MGERKVVNKYFPSDFDPSGLPRVRRSKNRQMKVRMMLPMTIRCNTCGHYMYKGTKFNSRKEDVIGETYLGIRVYRFYFKCTHCSAERTIKTDPQNSDYTVVSRGTRNFEPWCMQDEVVESEKRKREFEGMGDCMKSLESRTLNSKREMDILAALYEMKSMNFRHATMSIDTMLQVLQRTSAVKEGKLEEEDEALTKSIVFHKRKFSEEFPNKPSDSLTKANSSDMLNDRGSRDRSASAVRISVVKKVAPTSTTGLQLSANEARSAMLAVRPVMLVTDESCISWYSVLHKDGIPSLNWHVSLGSVSSPFSSNVNGALLS